MLLHTAGRVASRRLREKLFICTALLDARYLFLQETAAVVNEGRRPLLAIDNTADEPAEPRSATPPGEGPGPRGQSPINGRRGSNGAQVSGHVCVVTGIVC